MNNRKILVALTVSALFLISPLIAGGAAELPDEGEWWNNRVFYEIFVRSFYDSDGDGIGDFQGIIARLDYLKDDLGIGGIWLMPVNQSPSYHGYDVSDYYRVNSDYGTLEDFQELIEECHKRDIKLIMDLVLNHTSTENPWFSEKSDWYIWSDIKEQPAGPWGQNVWYLRNGRYYYSVFDSQMADLNYGSSEVTTMMKKVIAFWLGMGIDGFRLDALKYLIESDGKLENTDETHQWLGDFYSYYKSLNPAAFTVGEVWDSRENILPYSRNETDMCFEFSLADAMMSAVKTARKGNLIAAWNRVLPYYDINDYATFLTNHDQDRVVSQLMNSRDLAKNAAFLLLTSPGTPFIYYGEEIGMRGVKPDEDIRRPFHWKEDTRDGFTTGIPWRWQERSFPDTLEEQMKDSNSLFSAYRKLIELRKNNRALRTGDMIILETSSPSVFAFLRTDFDQTLLSIINLGKQELENVTVTLDDDFGGRKTRQIYKSVSLSPSGKTRSGQWIVFKKMEGFSASVMELEQ